MITLYGDFPTIEALTFDLRLALLALGLRVAAETTTGKGERLVRVLRLERNQEYVNTRELNQDSIS